jgi:GT2 family glycosyltransferase
MPNKLLVVTVNYACADPITAALATTVAEVRKIEGAEYWIVDNASPDDSVSVLNAAIAAQDVGDVVRLLEAPKNDGFGAGNNVALRKAFAQDDPPEYIYFLNPDAVPLPGAIPAMLAFLEENQDVGMVGGLLRNEDDELEASSFRFPSLGSEIETAFNLNVVRKLLKNYVLPLETPTEPTRVDWVSGASFLARRTALETTGIFDETFFLYWEEVELCHRFRLADIPIYTIPDATVMHIGGVSTGIDEAARRKPEYWFASRRYFFKKTGLAGSPLVMNLGAVIGMLVHRLGQLVRGRRLSPPRFLTDFVYFNFLSTPQRTGKARSD